MNDKELKELATTFRSKHTEIKQRYERCANKLYDRQKSAVQLRLLHLASFLERPDINSECITEHGLNDFPSVLSNLRSIFAFNTRTEPEYQGMIHMIEFAVRGLRVLNDLYCKSPSLLSLDAMEEIRTLKEEVISANKSLWKRATTDGVIKAIIGEDRRNAR